MSTPALPLIERARLPLLEIPEFDAYTEKFLTVLKTPGTRRLYRVALSAFQKFYEPHGTIADFLKAVKEDQAKLELKDYRVDEDTLREFVESLEKKGMAAKTVRVYVAAIQSELKYYRLPVSVRYLKLPANNAISEKYSWTIETVSKLIDLMQPEPMYQSLAAVLFQSGLGIGDALALTYGKIKAEYEAGTTPLALQLIRMKTEVKFITFIGKWSIDLLRTHLLNTYTSIKPEDKLFPVSRVAVDEYFRSLAPKFVDSYKGRNPIRPHSLRAAFKTLLGTAKLEHDFIEFFMGHKLPEQERVYNQKSPDGWRQTYRQQAEPFLTPTPSRSNLT
jgi:integrase/recombinase XerD